MLGWHKTVGSYIQKMRESHLLLVSRSKALASPNKSKRNNAEAHAWVYKQHLIAWEANDGCHAIHVPDYIHLQGRLCCFDVWLVVSNCQILERQAQSVKYAFSIYRFPASIPLVSGTSAREQLQKYNDFLRIQRIWRKNQAKAQKSIIFILSV